MKGPTLKGCVGALVAIAVTVMVVSLPGQMSDVSPIPRIETFISAACGGPTPCPAPSGPNRLTWVHELEKLLAERMPDLPKGDRNRLADAIIEEARAASLDPLFILALIGVESGFNHTAESEAGALGLMQLRPSTLQNEAARSHLPGNINDPVLNVRAGIRYYQRLVRSFGSSELALMAYNAGPNRILRYLGEGTIPERFQVYPRRIQQELGRLRRRHRSVPPVAAVHVEPGASTSERVEPANVPAASAQKR